MDFLIVTGMSGAGKSQAAHALEDIGFYCADNIPPSLIWEFYRVCARGREYDRVAVIVDARAGRALEDLPDALKQKENAPDYRLLFLEASDEVLLRRYRATRRHHPLLEECGGDLGKCFELERTRLMPMRNWADYRIDTTFLSPSQLKERISTLILQEPSDMLTVHCMSFGFKHGVPQEADLMFDVRCLPNPYYIPELKEQTGLDAPVYDYVMQWEQSIGFRERLTDMVDYLLPLYRSEGKCQLTIAIGCTGGHHRSVSMVRALCAHLQAQGQRVTVFHRDIEK